jgi:hypothetical protein
MKDVLTINKLTILSLVLFWCILITGCTQTRYIVDTELMQESFLIKCPEELPSDYTKDGNGWTLMAKEWSTIYHQCAIIHNGTVDAIRINNKN